MCRSAAVYSANWLWDCCLKAAKFVGEVLNGEQIGCGIADVKGAK